MSQLSLLPTDVSQWQALLMEAQERTALVLSEDLESYLVFLLMRFCQQTDLLHRVVAMDFLQTGGDELPRHRLQRVGDQCLLLSGLFPERIEQRRLQVSYYVNIGRSAYDQLSDVEHIFSTMAQSFQHAQSVLYAMRGSC